MTMGCHFQLKMSADGVARTFCRLVKSVSVRSRDILRGRVHWRLSGLRRGQQHVAETSQRPRARAVLARGGRGLEEVRGDDCRVLQGLRAWPSQFLRLAAPTRAADEHRRACAGSGGPSGGGEAGGRLGGDAMLTLGLTGRIWVRAEPIDGRKSFDGLSAAGSAQLGRDPLSGDLFWP